MGDIKEFISNIDGKFNDKECAMCGNKEWGTLPLPMMIQVGDHAKQAVPVAAKFCGKCGHMNAFLKMSKG